MLRMAVTVPHMGRLFVSHAWPPQLSITTSMQPGRQHESGPARSLSNTPAVPRRERRFRVHH